MKRLLLLFLCFFVFLSGYSQTWKLKRFEVWGGVSVFQYYGDIGGSADRNNWYGLKDISVRSTRPGINLGVSYRVNERIYVHGTNALGFFASTDKRSRNSARNYAFTTIADEIVVDGVFYIIKEKMNYYYSIMRKRGGLRKINQPLSLYAFAGFGGLFFKPFPKDYLKGSPRFSDNNIVTLIFPVGLGTKLAYTPQLSFGVELGARYAFSDRIDGLTTQFSKHNDFYYILNFKAIYRLQKGKGLRQQIFGK